MQDSKLEVSNTLYEAVNIDFAIYVEFLTQICSNDSGWLKLTGLHGIYVFNKTTKRTTENHKPDNFGAKSHFVHAKVHVFKLRS